jgi:hypothetical protein
LEALANKGFVQIGGFVNDGRREIGLVSPFIKEGVDRQPIQPISQEIPSLSIPTELYSPHIASSAIATPVKGKGQGSVLYNGEPVLQMASDFGQEREILAGIQDFVFTRNEQREFRRLLRRYGSFLINDAIAASIRQGQIVTFSDFRNKLSELASDKEIPNSAGFGDCYEHNNDRDELKDYEDYMALEAAFYFQMHRKDYEDPA